MLYGENIPVPELLPVGSNTGVVNGNTGVANGNLGGGACTRVVGAERVLLLVVVVRDDCCVGGAVLAVEERGVVIWWASSGLNMPERVMTSLMAHYDSTTF